MFVIHIAGLADGRPTPHDDTFLVAEDVDANGGRGETYVTKDVDRARRFASVADAVEYWKRESTVTPLRPDGKPNRPLTAYTINVQQIEPAEPRRPDVIDGTLRGGSDAP